MSVNADLLEHVQSLESPNIAEAEEIKDLIINTLRQNKEGWLLNAVIDFFLASHSQRCLTILESVREPYDKQVFDKLVESIKGPNKLGAVGIIGHLASKPPPWLHKITNHSLMKHLIKVMNSEIDVPVLVSTVLTVTSLLPLVPVSVQSYINDILEAFSRLAACNFRKASHIPDIYLLHLHAAIYSLFHRMHGMFPCHLIYFLRSFYSKKDNQAIFDSKIAPMLERVRMNPLLVTASKDKEVSRERWRQKEVHDIIVDCAKLSLDLIEGGKEQGNCPFTDAAMHGGSDNLYIATPSVMVEQFTGQTSTSVASKPIILSPEVLSSMYSPSVSCGLSTPPPESSASQSINMLEGNALSQPGTHRTTPYVHDSPHPMLEPTTPVLHQHIELQPTTTAPLPPTPGHGAREHPPMSNKRLSAMSLSLSGKGPTTPSDLVPPSPQKFDFSSEPPLHAQKMQAIRKLNFQGQSDETDKSENVASGPSSAEALNDTSKEPILTYDSSTSCCEKGPDPPSNPPSPSKKKRPPPLKTMMADTFDFGGEQIEQGQDSAEAMEDVESSPSVPSINQLPDIIGNLQQGNVVDAAANDEEVQKLTDSCEGLEKKDSSSSSSETSPHSSTALLTAQSVQAFMKNVKRIRFNSMNVGKLREMTQQDSEANINPKRSRSNSCPDLETDIPARFNEDPIIRQRSYSGSGSSSSDSSLVTRAKSGTPTKSASGVSFTEPIEEEEEIEIQVTQDEPDAPISELTSNENEQEKLKTFTDMFPYHHLFPITLPVAPFMKCYNCRRSPEDKGQDKVSDFHVPLFTSYSPPDLLDRHLKLSCELHSYQLDALECKTATSPAIRRFGGSVAYPKGLPPADEIKILRGEIQLQHNQVMYERHKRELYAKRNRRLLSKITKATALEEQNSAMQDQLRLKESEVQSLHVTMRLQQKQVHDLQQAKEKLEKEKMELQKSLRTEVSNLQSDKRDLQSIVDTKIREHDDVKRDLHNTKSQMFNFVQELTALQTKADFAAELQEQVVSLNKELLLMGELQQKYRQRLATTATMHNPKPEQQLIIQAYKRELASAKAELEQKTVNYDAVVTYRATQDEQLVKKDTIIAEQKRTVENSQAMYKAQHDAAEEKYRAQLKIIAALNAQILELRAKLEERAEPQRSGPVGVPIDVALRETGDVAGADGGVSPHSTDSHVEEASECWELSPSDSPIISQLKKP